MTPNQKLLTLLDQHSRTLSTPQQYAEIAAVDGELPPELRSELENPGSAIPDLEGEVRAALENNDQVAANSYPEFETQDNWASNAGTSFSSCSAVAAEQLVSAVEKRENTLRGL